MRQLHLFRQQTVQSVLQNEDGSSEFFALCLCVLLTFLIGGILIKLFVPAFENEIIPSVIETLKNILTI